MLIAKMCVILHNLIVRMEQNVYFTDKAGRENLITEFPEEHDQERNEEAIEYEQNRRRIQSEVSMDWEG